MVCQWMNIANALLIVKLHGVGPLGVNGAIVGSSLSIDSLAGNW